MQLHFGQIRRLGLNARSGSFSGGKASAAVAYRACASSVFQYHASPRVPQSTEGAYRVALHASWVRKSSANEGPHDQEDDTLKQNRMNESNRVPEGNPQPRHDDLKQRYVVNNDDDGPAEEVAHQTAWVPVNEPYHCTGCRGRLGLEWNLLDRSHKPKPKIARRGRLLNQV
jgi:hypothetical protein